jgi:hypothetical protein
MFADDTFGLCPRCHKTNGFINIGRSHWMHCRKHRTKWLIGSNLFSSWRYQTEGEQRAQYEAMDFGSYENVEAFFYPSIVRRVRAFLQIAARRIRIIRDRDEPAPF